MEDKIELTGLRLRLTNDLRLKYALQISRIANDPEIARRIGGHGFPNPYTEEDARIFLVMNAVEFETDTLGKIYSMGPGAGKIETAQSALTDLVSILNKWHK